MIYIRRVVGHSMVPVLQPGQLCLFVAARNYNRGDIVLADRGHKQFVKRISLIKDGVFDLKGDNSADSLDLVAVPESEIIARLVWPRYAKINA